mgnify:CR=1
MRIISHRGNLTGPNVDKENTESYLLAALGCEYDIEFDLWYFADKFWLGHDQPTHSFSFDHILTWSAKYSNQKFYVHCKNMWALEKMTGELPSNVIPFFHDIDQCILLRDGYIWVHPNAIASSSIKDKSIAVFSACKTAHYDIYYDLNFRNYYGICTDYPEDVRNSI